MEQTARLFMIWLSERLFIQDALRQGVLDVLETFSDFGNRVLPPVFVLDVRRNGVFLLFQKLENLLDRRVALSPGCVRAIILLTILQMQVGNAVVVLLDESDWIIAGSEKMTDVQIDAEILRHRHGLLEAFRLGEFIRVRKIGMTVHPDPDFVLVSKRRDSLCRAQRRRCGDELDAERLSHPKAAINLFVGETIVETDVITLKLDARSVELFPDRFKMIEWCR